MVEIRTHYRPSNSELNELNKECWERKHVEQDYSQVLDSSLAHICAFDGHRMIGFVNVAWDGGVHAFLLDTAVAPGYRRKGIASKMIKASVEVAQQRGAEWLHVDFEAKYTELYAKCGFRSTEAGLIALQA